MPFIKAKVSCPITAAQEMELKTRLGKAIELAPGKTEAYLLLEFWFLPFLSINLPLG